MRSRNTLESEDLVGEETASMRYAFRVINNKKGRIWTEGKAVVVQILKEDSLVQDVSPPSKIPEGRMRG